VGDKPKPAFVAKPGVGDKPKPFEKPDFSDSGRREFEDREKNFHASSARRYERKSFDRNGPRRDYGDKPRYGGDRPRYGDREGGERRSYAPGGSGFGGRPQRRDFDRGGSGRAGFERRESSRDEKPKFDHGAKVDPTKTDFGGTGSSLQDKRMALLQRAKESVKEAFTGKGAALAQSIRALDDLDYTKSLLFSRLQEYYGIHFPELKLDNMESYAKIAALGDRKGLDEKKLAFLGHGKATQVVKLAEKSFGSDLTKEEMESVQNFATALVTASESREKMAKFIDEEANRVMPNVTALTDAFLAARFLSLAGSLEKMARMPSSTIQVMGAETALFMHLRSHGRTPPPKHGIIFQSALVRGAPLEQRGKIARALAGKISIAVKADAYTGNFIAEKLKKDLDERLKEIRG
jgi:hypothetical protein